MGAAREKDQADFDLERFVDMFDEAMTSRDPRVISALRSLMMVVTLTRPEANQHIIEDRNRGPLRRLFEDINHLHRRLERMEDEIRSIRNTTSAEAHNWKDLKYPYEKYTMQASQALAAGIDADIVKNLGVNVVSKINKPKGLLDK